MINLSDIFQGRGATIPNLNSLANGSLWVGLPNIQVTGPVDVSDARVLEESQRRDWVLRAFKHMWEGYKTHAFGHDQLSPVSNSSADPYNGWGATIIDALDTLLVMNLTKEYEICRPHIASIDFTYTCAVVGELGRFHSTCPNSKLSSHSTLSLFETTIRYLGGLISAYDLSGDQLLLDRAIELGNWLLPALGTKSGLPVNAYEVGMNPDGGETGSCSPAEVGSLTLEMIRLSMLTGDDRYYAAVQRITDFLESGFSSTESATNATGGRLGTLFPISINPDNGTFASNYYSFSAYEDSYYEYLLKTFKLTGGIIPQYKEMWESTIDAAYRYFVRPVGVVPGFTNLTVVGSYEDDDFTPSMDHLTCFVGGMLALGSKLLNRPGDFIAATNITNLCIWGYESMASGVGGESFTLYKNDDPSRFTEVEKGNEPAVGLAGTPAGVSGVNGVYMGRPEAIESVFYMWRTTGDRYWQDKGWSMFTAWVKASITEAGFATLKDVTSQDSGLTDDIQSFVYAETFKYYYLLFSPFDLVSLDDWVFNTECHPFRIPKPKLYTTATASTTKHFENIPNTMYGQGTAIQQWARIQEASGLLR
ncbi:seven-hairpin glycosidase [Meredithblackwellia eburnea MCA 4105]